MYYDWWGNDDTPRLKCANGIHEWVDTGLIRTFCKHCEAKGEWCRRRGEYVSLGLGKASLTDDEKKE